MDAIEHNLRQKNSLYQSKDMQSVTLKRRPISFKGTTLVDGRQVKNMTSS